MSVSGPGGNFDYPWEDPPANASGPFTGFDNFDLDGWNFKPAAVPWYRTRRATVALIATAVAAGAIVVSGVLLLLRDSPESEAPDPTTTPSPSATSSVPSPSLRVGVPPAPPEEAPPAPPPEETPQAPVYRPTHRPTATKKPEIGVTRTPVTRSPISVAPQPRHPRN